MKKAFVIVCLALFPLVAISQGEPGWNKSSLGANFEVSSPTGNFSSVAGIGYGGNVRYQFGADPKAAFTATAGYLVWGSKDIGVGSTVQPKAFNIFAGGKYYFTKSIYGSLEGGLYFLNYTRTGQAVGVSGSTTWFMLPIGLGYQMSGFEVGVRYMLLDVDAHSFSFTLGYNFMLN